MNLKFKGVHGTCLAHAEAIQQNGPRAAAGRAGTGFYLWAYHSNPERAYQLARDWYSWRSAQHAYDSWPLKERGMALLTCEIEVDAHSYLNLNQTRHHEMLAEIRKRVGPGPDASKIFDDYLLAQAEYRSEVHSVTLKVVEAMVHFPLATKTRQGSVPLTPGADAFIVLDDGLTDLIVTKTTKF